MYFGFDHVSIAYGKKQILDDVTMEFEKGKITTINKMLCHILLS